jgi:hypothetical protein
MPQHSACYAHTLQLVVKDGLKDAGNNLKTIIAKASTAVRYVSCIVKTIFNNKL